MDDMELVGAYVTQKSEMAFETLVARHIDMVYSAALRQVYDPHIAEEITQATFTILARKAATLRQGTILSAWLFRTARFAAMAELRATIRRQRHEKEAQIQSMLQSETPTNYDWDQVAPLLDEAIAQLGERDRNAVVLRFLQQQPLKDVGVALRIDAKTAQKRVSRAVERFPPSQWGRRSRPVPLRPRQLDSPLRWRRARRQQEPLLPLRPQP